MRDDELYSSGVFTSELDDDLGEDVDTDEDMGDVDPDDDDMDDDYDSDDDDGYNPMDDYQKDGWE